MDKKNDKQDEKKQEIENLEEKIDQLQEETKEKNETNEEVEKLKQKIIDCEDKFRRALADYQNLQRRTQEQKAEWIRSANRDLLLKLLPVLDTLMLANKHIQDKGLQLSIDQFLKVLEQEGVSRIKTVGEVFDPYTMEAITTQEGEEGKVLEEVRAGFKLYEVVLRSAQVIVGKKEKI